MTAAPKPRRRLGCIVLASFLFAFWITVAFVFWQAAMNMPDPDPQRQDEEKPTFFELMPKAEGS